MAEKPGRSSTNIKERNNSNMKRYTVYDSCGYIVRGNFPSYKAAYTFKIIMNRLDWTIK